jgi:hypothetical protein
MSIEVGQRFGSLVAREPIGQGKFWWCDCDCGGETRASKWHLLRGRRLSCRCRLRPVAKEVRCTACDTDKPRADFYLRPGRAGGLNSRVCRECVSGRGSAAHAVKSAARRKEALTHYGGDPPICSCCGEPCYEFLQIDHSRGGGAAHRREIKATNAGNIYNWLHHQNYPDNLGLRVLCANCNWATRDGGVCPHMSAL